MSTVAIRGTDNGVMVEFGKKGEFIRGDLFKITTTSMSQNEEVPVGIRENMVGLTFEVCLTSEQVYKQCGDKFRDLIPPGCCMAYASVVVESLRHQNKSSLATDVELLFQNRLDMWLFEEGTFCVVKE